MRAATSSAVRRECRRVAAIYAALVEAALDQPNPSEALRAALARILADPMLCHFSEAA